MPDLRPLRRSRGLTTFEVAQRSGLTARAIAELEFGLCPLDPEVRLSLARVYDLAPEDLQTPSPSASWEALANRLSQQVILAALISTLVAVLLFGGAISAAESHAPPTSKRAVAHAPVRRPRPPGREPGTPTSAAHGSANTTLLERAIFAVSPTMVATVTPEPRPSATSQQAPTATPPPKPTATPSLAPTDTPSLAPAALLELDPTELPSPVPTELPSLPPTAAPDPASTDTPGPMPTELPNPTPTDTPSPTPTDTPSPTPTAAPSPAATNAPSSAPSATPSLSAEAAPQTNGVFMPLPPDGPIYHNVVVALEANNGALQHVVIPPDGVWSFNRSIGDPALLQLESVYGVYGGGWCDLASRYTTVLRPFLPPESFDFIRHIDSTGYGLEGIPDEDAVVIWNSNGGDDEQDLRIHNTSGRTITMHVTLVADGVQFDATLQ
jgi:transcriptional regulator with XRE-family HTH domain